MKKVLVSLFVLTAAGLTIVSCGSSNSSATHTGPSKLPFRVFVTNPLFLQGVGSHLPVVNIVDATNDVLSRSLISLSGNSTQPGLMALSPNRQFTMIFSPLGNTISLLNNSTESIAQTTVSSSTVPAITLPGFTESMFIGNNNTTGYAAVPTAPVMGQAPGAVVVLNLLNGTIAASVPVPSAHFIVPSPDGNHILAFSDNSDTVTVITTIAIGTSTDPRSYITGFDRPVWGIFIDNVNAYVLNCGPQCAGKAAGVGVLNVNTLSIESTTPVSAATYGLLNGSDLYVAGTPPASPVGTNTCAGTATAATSCGRLSVVATGSMTVTGSAIITDGYHDRMQISQDGQLFIGSHDCSNINSGGEVRGCLTILNTNSSKVVIPPQNGDVTGIQPITGRPIVYLIQNGQFWIYDTTTDTLQVIPGDANNNNGQIDIVGQLSDLKLVD